MLDKNLFGMQMQSLSACLIADISVKSIDEYFKQLSYFSAEDISAACENFKRYFQPGIYKKFPSVADFREFRAKMARDSEYKTQNVADKDSAIPNCVSAYFAVVDEIWNWHTSKLVEYNHDGCKPMTLEEWDIGGRPKTWSPILDHFTAGLFENRFEGFEKFCRDYVAKLRVKRLKRMSEQQPQKTGGVE